MKLSEVRSDADWEEYLYRKSIATHEKLRIESGIGEGAHRLLDSYDADPDDGRDFCKYLADGYGEDILA